VIGAPGKVHMEDVTIRCISTAISLGSKKQFIIGLALHTFASYFYNSRWIVLHFEHFVADGDVRLVRVLPQGRIIP
jgi:hypothetical protein